MPTIEEMISRKPYSFFLDSASPDREIGVRSFAGWSPFLVFKSKGQAVTLQWSDGRIEHISSDPFVVLKNLLDKYHIPPSRGNEGFTSGAVGYFSYDLKDLLENLPGKASDDLGIPDCILAFYNDITSFDPGLISCDSRRVCIEPSEVTSNFSRSDYINAVKKAKEHIRKGDIYQVNLSQRFHARLTVDPIDLYMRLRRASPAPFSAYLDLGEIKIISSSPERFLLKKGRHIETRPIKGTRPRSEDPARDRALGDELSASPKDRAEHIMIVDLERNDLGRICEYGSVRPVDMFRLEKYANVFHLVSTVSGRLKKDIDAVDCIKATFPGGSITGAPKIRSMEIIDSLEPVKRSVYTGALGYISFTGDMDLSIAIRTFVIKGRDVYFQVGGGIVADSDPEKEYEETLDKAKGLMAALGVEAGQKEHAAV